MSILVIYILFACFLLVPVLGALLLRVLDERLSEMQIAVSAVALVGVAIASVLVLAWSDVNRLEVGDLNLLRPASEVASSSLPEPRPDDTIPADIAALTTTTALTGTLDDVSSVAPTATETTPASLSPTIAPVISALQTQPGIIRAYVTQEGDTLLSVADAFNVSVDALLAANDNLDGAADAELPPGQELRISVQPAATPRPVPLATPEVIRAYVTQDGDTLRSVADTFNVSVDSLLAANSLDGAADDTLAPGQELRIP